MTDQFEIETATSLAKIETTLNSIDVHFKAVNGSVFTLTKQAAELATEVAVQKLDAAKEVATLKLEAATELARLKLEAATALNTHTFTCPVKSLLSETDKIVIAEREKQSVNMLKIDGLITAVKWLFSVTVILSLLQAAAMLKFFHIAGL